MTPREQGSRGAGEQGLHVSPLPPRPSAPLRSSLVVAQAGGPTAVINASLAGVVEAAQASGRFARIWGLVHGLEGALRGEMVDLTDLTSAQLDRLAQTPAAALGGSRYKLTPQDDSRIMDTLRQVGAAVFIGIGGNGTMTACDRLARALAGEVAVVGVPKTVDNDLAGTDHCPGYGSAARAVAQLTRDTALDLRAMRRFDRVVILEAMGRDAGWLAAAAALARTPGLAAPHLVYVPERPLVVPDFLAAVEQGLAAQGWVYVAVSEGVRTPDGTLVSLLRGDLPRDALDRPILSLGLGPAQYLAEQVGQALGVQTRTVRLSTVQRASSAHVSSVDRAEAWTLGRAAVARALAGESDIMVGLRRAPGPYAVDIVPVALAEVAGHARPLPDAFLAADRPDVTPTFIEWLTPLLGDPLPDIERLPID